MTFSMSGGNTSGLPFEKIPEDSAALACENRLRVKLHPMYRPPPVAQTHDDSVFFRSRRDLELRWKPLLRHHQRVIARGDERLRDPVEHAAAVVLDCGRLA